VPSRFLQQALQLDDDPGKPLVVAITRLVPQKVGPSWLWSHARPVHTTDCKLGWRKIGQGCHSLCTEDPLEEMICGSFSLCILHCLVAQVQMHMTNGSRTPPPPSTNIDNCEAKNCTMRFPNSQAKRMKLQGIHLLRHAVYRTAHLGGQFVLLGSGHADADFVQMAQGDFRGSRDVRLMITYSDRLAHLLYAAADIILVPSLFEPCGVVLPLFGLSCRGGRWHFQPLLLQQ